MSEILIILSIIVTVGIGYIIIRGFNLLPYYSFYEVLGYSYGLGVGLIAYQMLLYSQLRLQWTVPSILIPWTILTVVMIIIRKYYLLPNIKIIYKLNILEKTIFVIICSLIAFVAFEALIRPLSAWDGWAIWLLRAKVFFFDGKINVDIFNYDGSDYPVGLSLFATFTYNILGYVNDRVVLLIFFMFYLSLAIVFFFSVKRLTSTFNAFIFTFLLLSLQSLIRQGGRYDAGYADLALGYYFFMIVILLNDFINKKNTKILILLNVLLGIIPFIKNEGLVFSVIIQIFIVYTIIKHKKINYIIFSLYWLCPVLMWQLSKMILQVPHSYIESGSFQISRLSIIFKEIIKEFINLTRWNLLWPAFFLSLLSNEVSKHIIPLSIILLQMTIYVLVYMYSPIDPQLQVPNSFDRLLIHISPLSVFIVGLIFNNIFFKKILRI